MAVYPAANSAANLGFYTYAALPGAGTVSPGSMFYTIDQGVVVSNGRNWVSVSTPTGAPSNMSRPNTNKWRAARGKVRAGIQNARMLFVGNSLTAGFNSTGVGVTNPASLSYPTQVAQIMNATGLPTSWQSWCGGQNITNFNTQDNRIVMGSWTNSGLGTFGANCLTLATTGQTLMSFTPTTTVDTVEVLALRNNSNVAITIAVDGGATLATYTPFSSGTLTMGISTPISLGTLASHAIQANISFATASFLDGMIAYNSAVKEVSVLRAGWQGATAASFNTSPWFYLDGVQIVAPDLTLIAVTRNDATSATDLAAFSSSYQNIITRAQLSGDVMLVIEPLGQVAATSYNPYVQAIYELARINNTPIIDFTQIWDVYSSITSWYTDTIHPFGFAYAEMARTISNILLMV